jgi:hypothetical protein
LPRPALSGQRRSEPQNRQEKIMELYRVTTIVRKYSGCKNVVFDWFRCERRAPRSYANLIENYDPSAAHVAYPPESCIDEMFELDEPQALKDYIDQNYGKDKGITTIKKATLPIANNRMGVGAAAVGGGDDFYRLDKGPNYSLAFKVWGYFNLVGCELADGSGETFRHYLYLATLDANGEIHCRPETQEEARRRESEPCSP